MSTCSHWISLSLYLATASIPLSTSLHADTVLIRDKTPVCVVLIPADADEMEKTASEELVSHLEKISGVRPEIIEVHLAAIDQAIIATQSERKIPISLGRVAMPKIEKAIQAKGTRAGTFALHVENDEVCIAGIGEGTIYGVYELLEQLGVRWFMPGDLGTVIPRHTTVRLQEQQTVQSPSFLLRRFQMPDHDWQQRVRCGGGPPFPSAHGLPGVPAFEKAPELYGLVRGERRARQHCLSNPNVVKAVAAEIRKQRENGRGPIVGMGPNDGGGFCECENCRALDGGDFDPYSNEPSVTDRYIWFFNQVLDELPEYPDTKIAFYIYHAYMRPPVREKPNPRIMGALAPIALDRVHGFSNPLAPEKHYARWLYEEWSNILPELYDRGYWSNLACPGFPFIIVHRLRDEIPLCHDLSVKGWRVETFPNYGPQLPSMYVAARLMWDHTADVDAILDDFAEKFFGPAREPMGRYIRLMDGALRDSDHSTGSSWDMPFHYPLDVREQARALLDEGSRLAANKGVYELRTNLIAQTFEMLEAFISMLESRSIGDFERSKHDLDRLDAIANALMDYSPVPMLSAGRHSTYVNYMNRFFRPCTEQGYSRVTGGNRLVAFAQDEWEFQIDPQRVGEANGFWNNDIRGGNWQKLKTSSSSWSNQGLRYYKGLAWYRQKVSVPREFTGQRLILWCGGVDEKAKIWLNGVPIGISHDAAFYPFELDATEAVLPGQENTITFCVANFEVDELGTGGIVAPVFLYAPKDGKEARLENKFPLGEIFP